MRTPTRDLKARRTDDALNKVTPRSVADSGVREGVRTRV